MYFVCYVVLPGKSFIDLYELPIVLQYCTYFRAQRGMQMFGGCLDILGASKCMGHTDAP